MNRWNIPEWLEKEVIARDKNRIYCGVRITKKIKNGSRKNIATWEHIINNEKIITRKNIALCCSACNSSKGIKRLPVWLKSDYCLTKNINNKTIARIAQGSLKN